MIAAAQQKKWWQFSK
ncbi:hypothetical protein [Bacillus sp. FSL K6-1145]